MNWAVVIAAIVTLAGGAAAYLWQRRLELETKIHLERREIYRSYGEVFEDLQYALVLGDCNVAKSKSVELRKRHMDLVLTAPDEVVAVSFELIRWTMERVPDCEGGQFTIGAPFGDELMQIAGRVFSVMRMDSFQGNLPVSFPQSLVPPASNV